MLNLAHVFNTSRGFGVVLVLKSAQQQVVPGRVRLSQVVRRCAMSSQGVLGCWNLKSIGLFRFMNGSPYFCALSRSLSA